MYEDIYESIRLAVEKRNLRDSTANTYYNNVRYFLRCTGKDVSELTMSDVETFLAFKRLEGVSPQMYNLYIASFRFFYKKGLIK